MAGNEEWKLVFQKELTQSDIDTGRIPVPRAFHDNAKTYIPPKFHVTLKGQKEELLFNAKYFILSGLYKFPWYNHCEVGLAFILRMKKHPSSSEEEEEKFSILIQEEFLDIIGTVYDPDPITANPPGQDLEFLFKCRLSKTCTETGRLILPPMCMLPQKFEATLKGETKTLKCSPADVLVPSMGNLRKFQWFDKNARQGQKLYLWKHTLEPNKVVMEIAEDPGADAASRDDSSAAGPSNVHDD